MTKLEEARARLRIAQEEVRSAERLIEMEHEYPREFPFVCDKTQINLTFLSGRFNCKGDGAGGFAWSDHAEAKMRWEEHGELYERVKLLSHAAWEYIKNDGSGGHYDADKCFNARELLKKTLLQVDSAL